MIEVLSRPYEQIIDAGGHVSLRSITYDDVLRLLTPISPTLKTFVAAANELFPLFGDDRLLPPDIPEPADPEDFATYWRYCEEQRNKSKSSHLGIVALFRGVMRDAMRMYDGSKDVQTGVLYAYPDAPSVIKDAIAQLPHRSYVYVFPVSRYGGYLAALQDAEKRACNIYLVQHGDGWLVAIPGNTPQDIFESLATIHLADVSIVFDGDLNTIQYEPSTAASALWLALCEQISLSKSHVRYCEYRKCKQPFIALDKHGEPTRFCCKGHRIAEFKERKKGADNE